MRKKSGVEPDSLSNDRKSVLMKKKMKMKKKLNTSLGGLKTLKQMSRKKYLKEGQWRTKWLWPAFHHTDKITETSTSDSSAYLESQESSHTDDRDLWVILSLEMTKLIKALIDWEFCHVPEKVFICSNILYVKKPKNKQKPKKLTSFVWWCNIKEISAILTCKRT